MLISSKPTSLAAAVAVSFLAACGPSPEQVARVAAQKELEQAAKRLEEAGKKMEAAATKGGADAATAAGEAMRALGSLATAATGAAGMSSHDPVDFRRLREVLPTELPGLAVRDDAGERNSAFGIAISEASRQFASDDRSRRVRLKITDPGTLSGPFALAHAWIGVDVDKDSSAGFERTATVDGRRIRESWRKDGQVAELQTVVGGRFLVEIETRGLAVEQARALLSRIDLRKLEAMKDEGRRS